MFNQSFFLSSLSKVFEEIINFRLTSFFKAKKLINRRQYGFQKNNDTQAADMMNESKNNGIKNLLIFFLQKAFDTVHHKIMLNKLHNLGIRRKANSLIERYLTNRHQQIGLVACGVTQGSILRPILFIAYINDLLRYSLKGEEFCYANDTSFPYNDRSVNTSLGQIQDTKIMSHNV